MKRIIALEGDTVYTKPPYPFPKQIVPVGHVWIEGDHPEAGKNYDSNWYGPVSTSLIVGKIGGVCWPLKRAGKIRAQDWKGSPRVVEGRDVENVEIFTI